MITAHETYRRKAGRAAATGCAGPGSRIHILARALPQQLAMSVLMAAFVPQPGLSKPQPKFRSEAAASRAWRASSVGGTIKMVRRGQFVPLPEQSKVKVRFEEDRILLFQKKRVVSIPASAVTELDHRAEAHSRSRQVMGSEGAAQAMTNCAGGGPQEGAACLMIALPFYAATAPFHDREHFIHITWRASSSGGDSDGDEEQEMELKVGKGEYRGLVAALERSTGKKCERTEPRAGGM